ncbi:MAG TPA: fibronectin type III domain-containing protein [Thermoplasmata archaeon]|nr:fibronectin type III domain-containing protein [Thermoplasmata archaeon]
MRSAVAVGAAALVVVLLLSIPPALPSAPRLAAAAPRPMAIPTPLRAEGVLSTDGAVSPSALDPGAAPVPGAGTPRNVLVDAPCNIGGNAEVQQAYDAALGYLYELWIGCGGIGFSRSMDGGYSFSSAMPVLGSSGGSSWDPAIALAPNGTVYVAFMHNSGKGPFPEVAWSWNHGLSFAGNASAFRPNVSAFQDRDFLAVAPDGTLYLTWDYSPIGSPDTVGCVVSESCYFVRGAYNILLVRSSTGGRNWSNPVAVDPEYPWGAAPAGPLVVTPNGTLEVFYEDYTTNASHYLVNGSDYYTRSFNRGTNWTPRVKVSNGFLAPTDWWIDGALSRAADGTLYAGFDTQNGTNDTAWVAVSTDNGSTWTTPLRVNPDRNAAAHLMVTPTGAGPGVGYVAWMTNNSTGATWSTWIAPITGNGTAVGSPSRLSAQTGLSGYWVGDTIGVTYLGSGTVAVSWTYGVQQPNLTTSSQVFAAIYGEPLPDAPSIVSVAPGVASLAVTWSPPVGGGPVSGFVVNVSAPGLPTRSSYYRLTTLNGTILGLRAFVHYSVTVAAYNPAGNGPASAAVAVTLTAWADLTGYVLPGSATVQIDGRSVPITGGSFSVNATTGFHWLNASAPGYDPTNETVLLPWNTTAEVWVNLTASPGSVRGFVRPTTATVSWDGVPQFVSGAGAYSIGANGFTNHTLRIGAPNFAPSTRYVTVPGGAVVWINVTLLPLNGTLRIAVNPFSALVVVNGSAVSLGTDGRANLSVPPGGYRVQISAPGYIGQVFNISVSPGSAVPVIVTLKAVPATGGGAGSGDLTATILLAAVGVTALGIVLAGILSARRERGPSAPKPEEPTDFEIYRPYPEDDVSSAAPESDERFG